MYTYVLKDMLLHIVWRKIIFLLFKLKYILSPITVTHDHLLLPKHNSTDLSR